MCNSAGLVVVEVGSKTTTCNVHMFGANPSWDQKLCVWGEARVMAEGKDSKTGNRGATMMFLGYAEHESDSVRMWDIHTSRVVVSRDVIWLKRMFFKEDTSGVIDLEALDNIEDNLGSGLGSENKNDEHPSNNQQDQPGGKVT